MGEPRTRQELLRRPVRLRLARQLVALAAAAAAVAGDPSTSRAQDEASGPTAVVVGGLRPARGRDYTSVRLEGLPEAQRLREIVEELTTELTQRPVLNDAALRAALGSGYLVDMVECEGKLGCVTAVFRSLRDRAAFLVYGDYAVTERSYLFRVRLVDLAAGKMLAEEEFSLDPDAIEDREAWKRELTSLLKAIALEKTTPPPENGGSTEAGGGGDTTEGGEGGAGEGDIDDLTDADFGTPVAEVAARPEPQGEAGSWIDVTAAAALGTRKFVFDAAPGMGASRPQGFSTDLQVGAGVALGVYPLARVGGRWLSGLGLHAEYRRTVASEAATGVSASSLYAAAGYRIAIGAESATLPRFTILAGYRREEVDVDDSSGVLPDLAYRGFAAGADVRVPLGTPRVAIGLGARYVLVSDAGAIDDADRYGSARIAGVDIDLHLELRVLGAGLIRLGGAYSRLAFDFDGNGAMSGPGTIGARDRYLAGTIAGGLLF